MRLGRSLQATPHTPKETRGGVVTWEGLGVYAVEGVEELRAWTLGQCAAGGAESARHMRHTHSSSILNQARSCGWGASLRCARQEQRSKTGAAQAQHGT